MMVFGHPCHISWSGGVPGFIMVNAHVIMTEVLCAFPQLFQEYATLSHADLCHKHSIPHTSNQNSCLLGCSAVKFSHRYQCFGGACHWPWGWRQYIPPKPYYVSAKLCGLVSQKAQCWEKLKFHSSLIFTGHGHHIVCAHIQYKVQNTWVRKLTRNLTTDLYFLQ